MIKETDIIMVVNQFNQSYYEEKLNCNLTCGQRIMIPVDILPPTSGVKVTTICEYCGKEIKKSYRRYIESINSGKNCCSECKQNKIKENTIKKYGVNCTLLIPAVHEKMIKNNLVKYGRTTHINEKTRSKMKETMNKKYGCDYTLQSEDLRSKVNQTMRKNGNNGVFTSKTQIQINQLLHGQLNYPLGFYSLDVLLEYKNYVFDIEYSGSGHDLGVRMGNISLSDFQTKEEKRRQYINDQNIYILEIISQKDKIKNEDVFLENIYRILDSMIEKQTMFLQYNMDLE